MPAIIPIVEGDGDVVAVPLLLRRLLDYYQCCDWSIGRAKKAGGLATLKRDLGRYLRYAQLEPDYGCSTGALGAVSSSGSLARSSRTSSRP